MSLNADIKQTLVLAIANGNCKLPNPEDTIEKDECMFSFDSPFSPQGLYTNLRTWKSFGKDFVEKDSSKTQQSIYLHQLKWKNLKMVDPSLTKEETNENPTKLAFGIAGGFSGMDDLWEIISKYNLCILPSFLSINLDDLKEEFPLIHKCCQSIIDNKGIGAHETINAWENKLKESKWVNILYQKPMKDILPSDRPSPKQSEWKCAECSKTENLWFNLSDGYIGCGRRQPDGSGGCGSALRHYQSVKAETGAEYPLAVKLGTLTPNGGDVWSYDEDDMISNPLLSKHLTHWGIDIMLQSKYEMSMEELQIEMNKNFIFSLIIENDKQLQHVSGPGLIGLQNLGNSCYMNALLQVLYNLPELQQKYFVNANEIFSGCRVDDVQLDLVVQMSKLAVGLLSERYILQKEEYNALHPIKECENDDVVVDGVSCVSVSPRMFKRLVGRNHPEFCTNRMQDVVEYFRHVLECISRAERVSKVLNTKISSLKTLFSFKIEERLECEQSHKVRYSESEDIILRVDIDLSLATNANEIKERASTSTVDSDADSQMIEKKENENADILPIIPLEICLASYTQPSTVGDWYSPATKTKGNCIKSYCFKTFPEYLAVQIQRYYMNDSWIAQKYDCEIPVPEILDLNHMRGKGLQENEVLLPKDDGHTVVAAEKPSEEIVNTLTALGIAQTVNAAQRAALAVNNANADLAAGWLMEHMMDADINDPLPDVSDGGGSDGFKPDPEMVNMLSMSMGFAKEFVEVALIHTNGDSERAVDWLFSRTNLAEEVANMKAEMSAQVKEAKKGLPDGNGKYELFAIVSHLGKATSHGHYVAHIKKGSVWYFFNDSKVAISQSPPFAHGYLYFFRRMQ